MYKQVAKREKNGCPFWAGCGSSIVTIVDFTGEGNILH